jgi:hypothetical protein
MVMVITRTPAKLLFLFFTFFLPIFSYAQKYSVGIKAGPLINWAGFGDKEDKDNFHNGVRLGYSAGGLISFPLKHEFDFFAEAAYSQKGRKLRFQDERRTNISTYKFIDLTMLLRKSFTFRLEKNIPSQWYFNIGPEISYWLSGKGTLGVQSPGRPYTIVFNKTPDGNFNYMYMNDVNRWLFGLALGVGFRAPLMRNQHINTEFRFVSGHTYFGNKDSSEIAILNFQDTMKTNLKVFQVNVSYTYDFDVQQQRKGKSTLDKKMKNSKHKRRR